jgi:serine/threonine protein kinase
MEKLNHPNIITYLGYEIKGNQYCVLMEYLPFSLWDIIKNIKDNKRSMFSKEEIIFCCIEILKALNYMHQLPEKILHRDLKSKNILVELKFGKIFMVKLCDLGDSTEYKEEIKTLNTIGTIRWTAPEILSLSQENKNIKYDEKSEIWSFAMVIYEILTLNLPYYEYEINDVKIQINQKKLPSTKNIDIKFLPILNLLKPCWNFNPKERPFVNQLLNDFLVMQK